MSPRAASRLATLGFGQVYDYVGGKADWGAAGLPLEGSSPSERRAGAHLRADVPRCRPEESLAAVRERVSAAGWDTCFVVDATGVLLGRIGRRALSGGGNGSAEDAMTSGPSTVRPSARLDDVVERMQRQDLTGLPVTTSDGRLSGLLIREDAEAVLP